MALQPLLKITSFSGSTNDIFDEFESLLQGAILVGNVGDGAQVSFLKLNLSGGALRFYSSLPHDTQTNLAAALTALRNRYNQAANQDFHRICFTDRKFDSTIETPEDFIVDLQRLALRAFPDIAAVGGANAVNRADKRTRRVKEASIQGMPLKFKRKLLKEDPARNVDDLGRVIMRELWISKAYPEDSYPGAFQQLREDHDSPGFEWEAISTLQDSHTKRQKDVDQKTENLSIPIERSWNTGNRRPPANNFRSNYRGQYQNNFQRGTSRGNNYRGNWNRGGYQPRGFSQRPRSPHPNRRLFCRSCGYFGHSQGNCYKQQQRATGQSVRLQRQPKKLDEPLPTLSSHKTLSNMYNFSNEPNPFTSEFFEPESIDVLSI